MSEEGRRVFKMDTVLGLLAGKGGGDVTDFMGYLTGRELNAQDEGAVQALVIAWLYKSHPAFMDSQYEETTVYDEWVQAQKKKHGDNISIPPIPADEMAPIAAILDTLEKNRQTIADQSAKIEELEGTAAELEPFKAQAEKQEKEIESLKEKVASLEEQNSELKAQTAEFEGKLPVAEAELNSTIADIVKNALKNAVAAVPAGAAAAGDEGAAAPVDDAGADDGSTAPPADDFGFGGGPGGGDGFGF